MCASLCVSMYVSLYGCLAGCLSWFCSLFYRGKFDNGGRFDLRLPYAEQGYVDEDADVMGKLTSFFGGGKPKNESKLVDPKKDEKEPRKKNGGWPW